MLRKAGKPAISVAERMGNAVHTVGARRGLSPNTRKSYGGLVTRFGAWAGTVQRAMDEGLAREWLSELIEKTKISFASQKVAANALARKMPQAAKSWGWMCWSQRRSRCRWRPKGRGWEAEEDF